MIQVPFFIISIIYHILLLISNLLLFMLTIQLVIFEIIIIIFFGAFIRIDSKSSQGALTFGSAFIFLIGITLIQSSKKKLQWTAISNLLIIVSITIQWYFLCGAFFNSCFQGFNTTYQISTIFLIQSQFCTLCILLTINDFIGKLKHEHTLCIAFIEILGFALNSAIINYGLSTFDGGGGIQIFLFSATFTIGIWLSSTKLNQKQFTKHQYNYQSYMFGLIGLLIVIYSWPTFNSNGSLISAKKISFKQSQKVNYSTSLQASAFTNTILALASSILCSLVVISFSNKKKIFVFIESIISAGILISSSADIILDPVGSVVLGGFASIITYLLFTYMNTNYYILSFPNTILRFIFSILSGVFVAIFFAGRNGRSPQLVNNTLTIAGYDVAAIIITITIALAFGCLAGFAIKYLKEPEKDEINQDILNWEIKQQMKPLYKIEEKLKSEINQKIEHNNLNIQHQQPQNLNISKILQQKQEIADEMKNLDIETQKHNGEIIKIQQSYFLNGKQYQQKNQQLPMVIQQIQMNNRKVNQLP